MENINVGYFLIDILLLIWIHFIADFVLQTDKIAINKSSDIRYLIYHCIIYSIPMLIFGLVFSIITGIIHFIVDFITSRLTTYFYKNNRRHLFFVVIGFDQSIHITSLILVLVLFGENYGS
jgi:hypothetical protein